MIVLVAAMLALGDWQLRRAQAGNALSWAYTFEWPIFAGFAVVFWAKTIRDEFHPPTRPERTHSTDVKLPGGVAAARSEPAGEEDEDEELAEYNAYLARLTSEVRGHGKWHGLR
jgi:DNA-binding transcriptional regulator of glucitol operon